MKASERLKRVLTEVYGDDANVNVYHAGGGWYRFQVRSVEYGPFRQADLHDITERIRDERPVLQE